MGVYLKQKRDAESSNNTPFSSKLIFKLLKDYDVGISRRHLFQYIY